MLSDEILKDLRKEISELEYKRYIKQISFNEEESRSNYLVFDAPNTLIANWIKTKYAEKIANIHELKTGIKPTVVIKKRLKKSSSQENIQNKNPFQIPKAKSTILNPSYTFDSFVVGSSNQYAFTAAKSVAQKPAIVYNPVFIYGPTGLGKTHLIQAIGNYALNKGMNVIYTTIEQFMNDFTYNLRNQTMDRFREKYRICDILLIDDIQFLSNKIQTQEEFFHTFNELYANKKQIVLTADKPPKKIAGLEERLQSRFEWGLIADIHPPELETKIAIIKKSANLTEYI